MRGGHFIRRLVQGFLDLPNIGSNPQDSVLQVIGERDFEPHSRRERLCFFAHFDPRGILDPYVTYYLQKLAELNFDTILITTSPRLGKDFYAVVPNLCRAVIHRRNIGLDFASWASAYILFNPHLSGYKGLLLANDSVFGPLFPLKDVFANFDQDDSCVWGLTSSRERAPHLQSYFLWYPQKVVSAEAFSNFWKNVRMSSDKDFIISRYEVGQFSYWEQQGVASKALIDVDQLSQTAQSDTNWQYQSSAFKGSPNPTLFMWDLLVRQFRFPFIKTELLKANRFQSLHVQSWRDLIPQETKVLVPMIENYIEAVGQI